MKRLPVFSSFLLFVALCVSTAYWMMQLYKPVARTVIFKEPPKQAELKLDAAAGLFGGKASAAVASNFQLKGVIDAKNGTDSVAILSADGRPSQAYGVGMEVAPGIKVKEIHPKYVMISDSGVFKRVELAEVDYSQNVNSGPYVQPSMPAAVTQIVPPATTPPPQPPPVQPAQPQREENDIPNSPPAETPPQQQPHTHIRGRSMQRSGQQ